MAQKETFFQPIFQETEKPAAFTRQAFLFGKKRGRKEGLYVERKRLTASAAFHAYRINRDYCGNINDAETNCVRFMKKSLPLYQICGSFLTDRKNLCILDNRRFTIRNRRYFV